MAKAKVETAQVNTDATEETQEVTPETQEVKQIVYHIVPPGVLSEDEIAWHRAHNPNWHEDLLADILLRIEDPQPQVTQLLDANPVQAQGTEPVQGE